MKSRNIAFSLILSVTACATASQTSPPDTYGQPVDDDSSVGAGGSSTPPPPDDPPPPPPEDPPPPPEDDFSTCATQTDKAQLKPLDMLLMIDRSGSMADDGKWTSVTNAIQQFAGAPDSAGMGVSLGYFPETYSKVCIPCDLGCGLCYNGCCALPTGEFCWDDGDCDKGGLCVSFMCHAGGGNASCELGDYATPEVALATLPAAAGALSTSLANTSPAGGTPTGPALQGTLNYAASIKAADAEREVVVVLATDGEPTECQPQGIGQVAAIAASGVNGPHAIPTFVVGVGKSTFNLNAIAAAGGTQLAYLVDANKNATQQFLATLNDIRQQAVACQYEIPTVNGEIDYKLVNVRYKVDNGPIQAVPKVNSKASCGLSGGWHYDNEAAPTGISLCEATCDLLQNSSSSEIEIVYGCKTVVK
jgi:hypothetical protein